MTLHRLTAGCLLLLLVFSIAGCSTLMRWNDSRSAAEIIEQAEQLVRERAYAAAAAEYAVVIAKEPAVGEHYLRRAELFERIDAHKDAYRTYKQAMRKVPEDDPVRIRIVHRQALLAAKDLSRLNLAENLLKQLPDKSVEKLDLAAYLYYHVGQYDQAISLINKALERVRDTDQKALLLYHAALIYVKLGDEKNTFGALFFSINNAEHLGLIRDIEKLWETIKEKPGPPS